MAPPYSTAVEQAIDSVLSLLPLQEHEPSQTHTVRRDSRAHLDRQVKTLELARSLLDLEIGRRIAALNHQRNTHIALNDLPTELLINILILSVDVTSWSVRRLQALASVTVRWWDIIKTTPRLWAFVKFPSPPVELDLALRMSRESALDISYDNLESHEVGKPALEFLAKAGARAKRWRALLFFSTDPHFQTLETHLKSGLPNLQRLELTRKWSIRYPRAAIVTLPSCPSLLHIKLRHTAITWRDAALSGLKTLDIRDEADLLPSNKEVITLLHSSPDLVELRLDGTQARREDDRIATVEFDVVEIPLRRLRVLVLYNVKMEMAAMLLARIRVECLEKLEVECFPGVSRADQLLVLDSISDGPLQAVARNNRLPQIFLHISVGLLRIQDRTSRQSLQIEITRGDWLHAAPTTSLFHSLAETNVPLTLALDYSASSEKTDPSFLAILPNLQTLTLEPTGLAWIEALKFLSEPQGGRLPCPQLRTVKVPWDNYNYNNNTPQMKEVLSVISHLVHGRRAAEGLEGLARDGGSVGQPTFMVLDGIGWRFDCEAMAFISSKSDTM